MNKNQVLFSSRARWIWDTSDRLGRNYYLRARRAFSISGKHIRTAQQPGYSKLLITADAYYQVWLNGTSLGHGPAKSPAKERFVDTYDVSSLLIEGDNLLEILVYSLGVGTMNYCQGEAGLIYEISGTGKLISSDEKTLVQRDPCRLKQTVRRWIMPYIEAIDAAQGPSSWQPANVVEKQVKLLARPVRLPSRQPMTPKRIVAIDRVKLPEFSCSFRIKPYLVAADQVARCNIYQSPAFIAIDLVSPRDQEITLVPTPGHATWYFHNQKVISSSGWDIWDSNESKPVLRLRKGANRLIGTHCINHFEEIHLAAFTPFPIEVRNPYGSGGFQIVLADKKEIEEESSVAESFEAAVKRGNLPVMNPADTLISANFQDLVVNARVIQSNEPSLEEIYSEESWKFPGTLKGEATRIILDLGTVHNGWLSFKTFGRKDGRFLFSFFEALDEGPPLRINWPEACNNAVSFRPKEGWQSFESFFAYGFRYISVHYTGQNPADLGDLCMLTAYCGNLPQGSFRSNDVTLNAVYSLCEQTAISATDDTLTDCPTYEAVNWNFDNRLGAMSDLVTCRNLPLLRNTIEQYTRDPLYPALVRSHCPSVWDIRIPIFSFHWIIFCQEFYHHTEDREFLQNVFPQIVRGIDEGIGMIDESGLLKWPQEEEPWHIIDWSNHRDDAGHPYVAAEQGMFLGTLDAAALLAEAKPGTQWKKKAKSWRAARVSLQQAIHRHFWQKEKDIYADSLHADGKLSHVTSQPTNCILAFYGVGNAAWRRRLAQRIRNDDPKLLPATSPMGMFYVLEFLDHCSDVEAIFKHIRAHWTQMVQAGDTTAWEYFPEFKFGRGRFPTRSRCHPFAGYILKYYIKYLLGLEYDGAAKNTLRFRPRPPVGIDECHGTLPLSQGVVRVGWKRQNSRFETRIEVPKGVAVKRFDSKDRAV